MCTLAHTQTHSAPTRYHTILNIHKHTYAHTYLHTYTSIHTTQIYVHICTHSTYLQTNPQNTHTPIHSHVYVYTSTHKYTEHTSTNVHTLTYMCTHYAHTNTLPKGHVGLCFRRMRPTHHVSLCQSPTGPCAHPLVCPCGQQAQLLTQLVTGCAAKKGGDPRSVSPTVLLLNLLLRSRPCPPPALWPLSHSW